MRKVHWLIVAVLWWMSTASPSLHAEPALVHITGNVIFTSSSNLIMELAGPTRGSEYDAMDVDGTIVLRGSITLERLGGYEPGFLVPHHVIHAGHRDGMFRSVAGLSVSPTRSLALTYVNNDIYLTATRPGDADVDGDVDFEDLLILAQHYDTPGTRSWQTGDFNGNAVTSFDDLLLLAQHYASSGARVASDLSGLPSTRWLVPEPVTLGIAIPAIATMMRRRRGAHAS